MSKTNLGQGRFMSRVISDWNALPEQVVTSSTVNVFKNQLDKYFEQDIYVYENDV